MELQKNSRLGYEVRVKAKLNELYDFDHFTKIQRKVIDELGCTACTSGVNLRFDIERFFGDFDRAEIGMLRDRAVSTKAVDVRVVAPSAVANRFESNVAARRAVLGELGCPACTSGYNIIFENELAFAVDGEATVVNLG